MKIKSALSGLFVLVFLSLLCVALLTACSQQPVPRLEASSTQSQQQQPAASAAETPSAVVAAPASSAGGKYSLEDNARVLVGLDRGQSSAASADDIDVKRARYLLGVLVAQTKETHNNISRGVDFAAEQIEEKYGRKVTRLQLLEDLAKAYSKKLITWREGDDFTGAALLWATLKYAK